MIRVGSRSSSRGILSNLTIPSTSASHPTCSFSSTPFVSSYKPSFRNPRASKSKSKTRKRIPNWKAEERSLRSELTSLEQRLNILDKREKSDETESNLPPLDEASLDEIHDALMLPSPATPQEARLANHALRRRIANANSRARNLLSLNHNSNHQQIESQDFNQQQILQPLPLYSERDLPPPSERLQDEIEDSFPPSTSHLTRPQLIALRLKTFSERLRSISNLSSVGVGTSEEGRLASEVEEKRRQISQRLEALIQSKKQSQSGEVLKDDILQEEVESLGDDSPLKVTESFDDKKLEDDLKKIEMESRQVGNQEEITTTSSNQASSPSKLDRSLEVEDLSSSSKLILDRLESLISSKQSRSGKGKEIEGLQIEEIESLPMGFATPQEWTALAVSFSQKADDGNLSRTLELMKRSGYRPNLELFNDVLDSHAERGDAMRCEETLSYMKTIGLTPSDHTVHSLVKSHVRSNQMTTALNLLSTLEDAATPAGMATYTLVIDSLLKNPSLPIQSLSWNLFYHMRLSAHPIPDVPVYSMMIRACAKGIPQPNEIEDMVSEENSNLRLPDAERALDLFKEMKEIYNLRPNVEIYNSLILTCSRRKDYLEEAWRLFREMCMLEEERISADQQKREADRTRLEEDREFSKDSDTPTYLRFSPDRHTYNALIAGCAREKDLHRARWLLAEMLRATSLLYDGGAQMNMELGLLDEESLLDIMDKRPDEETISWILKCYASFKAPLKRSEMKLKERQQETSKSDVSSETRSEVGEEAQTQINLTEPSTQQDSITSSAPNEIESRASAGTQDVSSSSFSQAADDAVSAFTYSVPQTSAEVIKEVRGLMARIIADQPTSSDDQSEQASRFGKGPLSNVRITPQVINSFLSVHSQHLPHSQRLVWHAENVGIDLSLPNQFNDSSPSTSTLLSTSESDPFTQFNVPRTGHTHLLSLELASTASIKDPINRSSVEIISFEAFKSFRFLEQLADEQRWNGKLRNHWGVDTQTIREVWSARIRALTKLGRLRDALDTLQKFVKKYPPPSNVDSKDLSLTPTKKNKTKPPAALVMGALVPSSTSISALQAFETSTAPSSATLLKFETPYLTFQDLELLYHRLTVLDRKVVRSWVQWVIHAYASKGEARKERYRLEREEQMKKDIQEAQKRELEEIERKERKERKAERRAKKRGMGVEEEVQLRIIDTSEVVDENDVAEDRLVDDVDLEEESGLEEEAEEMAQEERLPSSVTHSHLEGNAANLEACLSTSDKTVDLTSITSQQSAASVTAGSTSS